MLSLLVYLSNFGNFAIPDTAAVFLRSVGAGR